MTSQPYPADAGRPPGAAVATPPKEVRTAAALWFVFVALGLVRALLAFMAVAEASPVLLVVPLVAFGLMAFLVVQMRAGKSWARIALVVLGAFIVVTYLFGVMSDLAGAGLLGILAVVVLPVLQILLAVAAIVFMYRPTAAAYFSAQQH